jgi:hypothetical protein
MAMISLSLQNPNHSRAYYTKPYDSTQGVPAIVFIGFWVIILVFGLRLAWEYRDKIFLKKDDTHDRKNPGKRKKKLIVLYELSFI